MSKKSSDWYIPPDWLAQLSLVFILPTIAILASILLPTLSFLKTADALNLFYSGLWYWQLRDYFTFLRKISTLPTAQVSDIRPAGIASLPPQTLLAGILVCRR
jgi:hypothetical protein